MHCNRLRAKQLRLVDPGTKRDELQGCQGFALTVFDQKSNQAKLICLEL